MNSTSFSPRRSLVAIALLSLAGCGNLGSLGEVLGGLGGPAAGSEVRGEIYTVDSRTQQLQIRTSDGQAVTLGYDSNTQVIFQNQRYAVANLERGDYVTARILQDNQGRAYTDLITVEQSVSDTGNATRQIFEGRVGSIDLQRGYFQLQMSNGVTYVVTLPYNPAPSDLDRFRRLRSGDLVSIEGSLLAQNRIELYRFR
jgi:hypothetical protein